MTAITDRSKGQPYIDNLLHQDALTAAEIELIRSEVHQLQRWLRRMEGALSIVDGCQEKLPMYVTCAVRNALRPE